MAGFRERAAAAAELPYVPHPAVTLLIDFGDALLVDGPGGRELRGSCAVGLAPRGLLGRSRDTDCLQLRLSPVAAYAVLGGAAAELGGSAAALDDVWGRDAAALRERLRGAASWDARFAVAEAALVRRRQTRDGLADPEVAFAWRQMARTGGRVRVAALAVEVGWSRKRLWSRFRSQLGVTPKRAAQLIRFDHASHRLAAGHAAAAVAAAGGYADQSHLHHDVVAFAGMTPRAVAGTPWLAVDPVAWPTASARGAARA